MYLLTCLSDNHITVISDEYSIIYDKIPHFVEEWCTREHDKDNFFSFNGDKKIKTFYGYLDPQNGYMDELDPCLTANIWRQVSVLVFQDTDHHTVTSCQRCVCIEQEEESIHGYSS